MVDSPHYDPSSIGDSRPVPDPTFLTDKLVSTAIKSLADKLNVQIESIIDKQSLTDRHIDITIEQTRELILAKIRTLEEADKHSTAQRIILLEEMSRDRDSLKELIIHRIDALTETVAVLKTTVNERFTQGDVQTEKAARDVKSAVDAAFAAAKEAVGEQNKSNALSIAKSEVATTKQIDQLSENLRINVKNTDDKIDGIKNNFDDKYTDLKDRVVAMEARGSINDPSTMLAITKLSADVANLGTNRDTGIGHKGGTADSMSMIGWIIGIIGVVFAVIEAVSHFGTH